MEIAQVRGLPFMPSFKMAIPQDTSTYPGGNVQSHVKQHGYWAAEESYVISQVLNTLPTYPQEPHKILDIGANTGYFGLIALSLGHEVTLVDANGVHIPYFESSIKENKFDVNKCEYIQAFVSNKKEDVLFDGWSGHDALTDKGKASPVKTISVKELCPNGCAFMKVDVEGAEPDVMESARPLLAQGDFPYIMLEVTYIINNKIDEAQMTMLSKLVEDGYELYEITPRFLLKIENLVQREDKWMHDYIYCHKKANPSLTCAGTNVLAIHNTVAIPPFQEVDCGYLIPSFTIS